MNTKYLLICCACLFLSVHVKGQISARVKLHVDQVLEQVSANEPGIIVGIASQDGKFYSKGKGREALGDGGPLTANTPFFLSSISKEFIGATIALLISEGKINLDAPIREYIPEFPSYDVAPTIYHALHHTSGIKDYSNLLYFRGEVFEDYLPLNQLIQLLAKQRSLNFTPGTEFLYSNSNFELLAEVITRVTGEDFRDYIRKNVFESIGMDDTYYIGTNHGPTSLNIAGYQMGPNNSLLPFANEDSPPVSVAQVISTVNDMLRWDRYLIQQLFKQDGVGELLLQKGVLNKGREIGYSMGFERYTYQDQEIFGHGGFSRGFQSNHAHFLKHEFSIIVFSNSLKHNTNYYTYQIADIIFKDMGVEFPANKNNRVPDLIISKKDSKAYLGSYYSPKKKMERVIYRDQGILRYNRPDKFESRLVPQGNHEFRMLGGNNQLTSKVSFDFKEGEAPIMKYHYPNSQEVEKYYPFEYHNYKSKELYQFAGTYYSEELDSQFEIKVIQGKLELYREGAKVSSLKGFKENAFRDNRLGGVFEFENPGGVKGFFLSQERARNVFFKKL